VPYRQYREAVPNADEIRNKEIKSHEAIETKLQAFAYTLFCLKPLYTLLYTRWKQHN
jgi:hypothetical protein